MHDLTIPSDGWPLAATCSGSDPAMVLLHPGCSDRRSWSEVMQLLTPEHPAIAYDCRGFGGTPVAEGPYVNTDDLRAVVDTCADARVALVGNSQGGRIAIDFALAHPDRVSKLVLLAPAVSGAPAPDWATEIGAELVRAIDEAEERADLDEVNRLEALIWLDGIGGPEGRVIGEKRARFLAMNRIPLGNESQPPPVEPPSAWERLDELTMPVLVIVGALDLPHQQARSRQVATRVPDGRLLCLDGVAHLPQLEDAEEVARVLRAFFSSS